MRFLKACLVVLLLCGAAMAAPHFPALTGRVVDDAHVLSGGAIQSLNTILEDYENGTSNQVVVVTVPSLNGAEIEDYGYQLGRHWGIGQQGKNNGVLLIVAPAERKVRIEVGYGLEGQLTDLQSSQIIQGIILPNFRNGQMEQGIVDGTQAIVDVLGGKSIHVAQQSQAQGMPIPLWAIIGIIILFFMFARRHPFLAALLLSNSRFGGGSGGGGGFGGFSGGGGSFGGGGSSGSW